MPSPFDYAKSATHTKDYLYTTDDVFNREYVPFLVNRSLSNSAQTALFADAINQYPDLDKKLQYDFYFFGMPKQKGYTKWVKKEDDGIPQEHIELITQELQVSAKRAVEMYKFIGSDIINKILADRGGKE